MGLGIGGILDGGSGGSDNDQLIGPDTGAVYTITGPDDSDEGGLIQRSFHYLFDSAAADTSHHYAFAASYLEIYNEQVRPE